MRRYVPPAVVAVIVCLLTLIVPDATTAADRVTCRGQVATIVGTNGNDVLYGTNRPDVIAGLGGNDRTIGCGGNDLVCGGRGSDRIFGVGGRDRLYGNAGSDRLVGGLARDRLFGGVGEDVLVGRTGNDRLNGGPGYDACYQNQGTGPEVSCEPPITLVPLTGILAVAYSDVDGRFGYSTGDMLISKLEDTNADGVPSIGDSIIMGRYPTNLDPGPSDFTDWGVDSHTVTAVGSVGLPWVADVFSAEGVHQWSADLNHAETYSQTHDKGRAIVSDGMVAPYDDQLLVEPSSPSAPLTAVPHTTAARRGNQLHVEVKVNPDP